MQGKQGLRSLVAAGVIAMGLQGFTAVAAAGTWLPSLPLSPAQSDDLSLFDDGTGYVFQSGAVSMLFATSDFGASWSQRSAPPITTLAAVRFGTPSLGYAVGNHGENHVFRSTDGGDSWSVLPGPPAPPNRSLSVNPTSGVAVARDGRTVAFQGTFGMPGGCDPQQPVRIFTSQDGGASWRSAALPFNGVVFDLQYLDRTNGAAVAFELDGPQCVGSTNVRAAVLVTHDGGRTFNEVLDCPESECTSVAMPTAERLVVGFRDGRIARSEDGGQTFTSTTLVGVVPPPEPLETSMGVRAIRFADCNVGYAATNGRGLWRTVDGGGSWQRELSGAREVHGQTNFSDLGVADRDHAIASGPYAVERRLPAADDPAGAPCPDR